MIFHDVLHGEITFRGEPFESLVSDLVQCPEVQRLRSMRLMNFDVPFIGDLASAKRFPHSVGAAHLMHLLVRRSMVSPRRAKALVAAALLHDIGIPPFGHLVETHLKKKWPQFSHEAEVGKIFNGTYHATNRWHQILPGASLGVARVLRQHKVDADEVLENIRPTHHQSAISADVDVDNLDTVHRMSLMMGNADAKHNLECILDDTTLSSKGELTFGESARVALLTWQYYRERIYSMIIGDPGFVAYNAFLTDIVRAAVDADIITPSTWFRTDADFERDVRQAAPTAELAAQLATGCRYKLVDYVWLKGEGSPPTRDWSRFDLLLESALGPLTDPGVTRFFWVEKGLVSRRISTTARDGSLHKLGRNSVSVFVALVARNGSPQRPRAGSRRIWREDVLSESRKLLPEWMPRTFYPESYTGAYFDDLKGPGQLELSGFAAHAS